MTGAELKAWREHINGDGHKMLQQDLADKLEIHRRTVQSWERKKASPTSSPGTAQVPLLIRLALGALIAGIDPLGGW